MKVKSMLTPIATGLSLNTKKVPWRFFNLTAVIFIGIGYLLYFSSLWLSSPLWGQELIDWLVPALGALRSAARVAVEHGEDPYVAQLMIVYGLGGCLVLPLIFCLHIYASAKRRGQWLSDMAAYNANNRKLGRVRLFFIGFALTLLAPSYVAFWFLDTTTKSIGWKAMHLYSGSFGSVTFFDLLFPLFFGMGILLSTSTLALPFTNYFKSTNSEMNNHG